MDTSNTAEINNYRESESKKIKTKTFVLIILFAIVFSFIINDGIRLVIQKFLEIPSDSIGLAQWGDTFFLRILASLVAMAAGTFVIGTFLKEKVRLAGVIAALPATLFWIATLIFGITIVSDYGYSFESVKAMLLLPAILAISLPVVGYFSSGWGQEYRDHFQKPKSVLDIKWYHWLWIFPFYLNKIVAILLFSIILLVQFDFSEGWTGMYPGILDFITNWGYYLGRIILLFIIIGLFLSVKHVYTLLSEKSKTRKEKWGKGAIIFGHVFLFSILYVLIFGQYL
ncbi:MAG: hypothetical protein WD312_02935 [Candidatus Paceibacterota bacterium]